LGNVKEIDLSAPANSLSIVPKKLTQAKPNSIEDELKRLRINPDY
jgi:hypothetical protein